MATQGWPQPQRDNFTPSRMVKRRPPPDVQTSRFRAEGAPDRVHKSLGLDHAVAKGQGLTADPDCSFACKFLRKDPRREGMGITSRGLQRFSTLSFVFKSTGLPEGSGDFISEDQPGRRGAESRTAMARHGRKVCSLLQRGDPRPDSNG